MRFTKMHGAGNDYVFLDGFADPLPDDLPEVARRISDRHFGVGGDGLIVFEPSDVADARMRMFNADGSEAEMCGNGLRCVAKTLYDRGHRRRERLAIETGRGVLPVENLVADGRVDAVRLAMGEPILEPSRIPTTLSGAPPLGVPLEIAGRTIEVNAVSMGNPHAVLFVDELGDELVHRLGPQVERHPAFPNRTNVEFVRVDSPEAITVRVWERGSGETLACGTGACAALVVAALTARTGRRVRVALRGGTLDVEWTEAGTVLLTGPAEEVFTGEWHGDVGAESFLPNRTLIAPHPRPLSRGERGDEALSLWERVG